MVEGGQTMPEADGDDRKTKPAISGESNIYPFNWDRIGDLFSELPIVKRENDRLVSLLADAIKRLDDPAAADFAKAVEVSAATAELQLHRLLKMHRHASRQKLYDTLLIVLHTLTSQLQLFERELAVSAILQGALTRRQAAGTLSVHENTVARWVQEAGNTSVGIIGRRMGIEPGDHFASSRDWTMRTLLLLFQQLQEAIITAHEEDRSLVDEMLRRVDDD
jgi:hypothetical protein